MSSQQGARRSLSASILVSVNTVVLVLAIIVLALAAEYVYGTNGISYFKGIPVSVFIAVLVFAGSVAGIAFLGLAGTCCHSRLLLILFALLDLVTALALIVVMAFVILYSNGISTTAVIDNNVSMIGSKLGDVLIGQAMNNSDVWILTEKKFGCCGIDFKETYSYGNFSLTDADFQNKTLPGDSCSAGRTAILSLHQTYPTYSAAAQTAAEGNSALGKSFFCKDVVSHLVKNDTVIVAALFGAIALLQLVTVIAAFRLLCRVSTTQGGFVKPPEPDAGSLAFGAPQGKGGPQINAYGGAHYA